MVNHNRYGNYLLVYLICIIESIILIVNASLNFCCGLCRFDSFVNSGRVVIE